MASSIGRMTKLPGLGREIRPPLRDWKHVPLGVTCIVCTLLRDGQRRSLWTLGAPVKGKELHEFEVEVLKTYIQQEDSFLFLEKGRWEIWRIKTAKQHYARHRCKGRTEKGWVRWRVEETNKQILRPYCWTCRCKLPLKVIAVVEFAEM